MSGKLVGIIILALAAVAGVSMYYLQVYAFYEDVPQDDVRLMSLASEMPEEIVISAFEGIDADSSPIRYRACFRTEESLAMLSETYASYDAAVPRNAPGWFECFDADAIAAELKAGTALPFLSEKNVAFGVDRVVAITNDGRGYIWHELNNCGEKAYDGSIVGEECPARE